MVKIHVHLFILLSSLDVFMMKIVREIILILTAYTKLSKRISLKRKICADIFAILGFVFNNKEKSGICMKIGKQILQRTGLTCTEIQLSI